MYRSPKDFPSCRDPRIRREHTQHTTRDQPPSLSGFESMHQGASETVRGPDEAVTSFLDINQQHQPVHGQQPSTESSYADGAQLQEGLNNTNNRNAVFFNGEIPSVVPVTCAKELEFVRDTMRLLCDYDWYDFPGSIPVVMNRTNCQLLCKIPYKVSWSADGVRYLMLIEQYQENHRVYMADRSYNIFTVPNLAFPLREGTGQNLTKTLLDGEMVMDYDNDTPIPRYLVFDIISCKGIPVRKCAFSTRRNCIKKEVTEPRDRRTTRGLEPFSIRIKKFFALGAAESVLEGSYANSICHQREGLIFQPDAMPYRAGVDDQLLKWKDPDMHTVDGRFDATRNLFPGGGTCDGAVFAEHCGVHVLLGPVTANVELSHLNNKIIECFYSAETESWAFRRDRPDKLRPNTPADVKAIKEAILDPLWKHDLFNIIERAKYRVPAPLTSHHSAD